MAYNPACMFPGESSRAYLAFAEYLMCFPRRTLAEACRRLGRPPSYERALRRWASEYCWRERARAFDVLHGRLVLSVNGVDLEPEEALHFIGWIPESVDRPLK
jgi:hypothetical protein